MVSRDSFLIEDSVCCIYSKFTWKDTLLRSRFSDVWYTTVNILRPFPLWLLISCLVTNGYQPYSSPQLILPQWVHLKPTVLIPWHHCLSTQVWTVLGLTSDIFHWTYVFILVGPISPLMFYLTSSTTQINIIFYILYWEKFLHPFFPWLDPLTFYHKTGLWHSDACFSWHVSTI